MRVIWLFKRRSSTAQTAKNPSADVMINFERRDTYLAGRKTKRSAPRWSTGLPFKCLRENKICATEDFNADLLYYILEPRDVQPVGRLPQSRIYSVTT